MQKLRIGLAQINPIVGNLEYNKNKILDFINFAYKKKVDILAFPELSVCGCPPEDLLLKEGFILDSIRKTQEIALHVKEMVVILGCVDRDREGKVYNSASIIKSGKIEFVYHKIELPNYGVFDEKRYFTKGKEIPVFSVNDIVFGVNICEDIWLDRVSEVQKQKGAQIILNISSSPYHMRKIYLRQKMIKEKARRLKVCIGYVNLVGGQDELVFDGGSFFVDDKGRLIIEGKQFEEELVLFDVMLAKSSFKKFSIDLSYTYKTFLKPPLVNSRYRKKKLSLLEETYKALVLGTRDYTLKNNFKKVVIGLSGGIDSSLTALIACDALGRRNVIGVSMPSRFSSPSTQKDAEKLARNLGIKFLVINIDKIFQSYLEELSKIFKKKNFDITEENLQARIRGNILMALSNKFGWLVLTTGNKSEVSCGYCTLYGDMAGGFNVLKDVYKTLVYKLAKFRNRKAGRNIIPLSVFKRPPSAELRPNQKDQDTLPPYSLLDDILKEYIEEDKTYREILKQNKFDPQVLQNVINMVDKNEYKRRQAPPGIKITPKAFGKDRRMPITNGYKI